MTPLEEARTASLVEFKAALKAARALLGFRLTDQNAYARAVQAATKAHVDRMKALDLAGETAVVVKMPPASENDG
jgi:phospholipase/lecithinase/hemolysin